jgi:hypothetical protein
MHGPIIGWAETADHGAYTEQAGKDAAVALKLDLDPSAQAERDRRGAERVRSAGSTCSSVDATS